MGNKQDLCHARQVREDEGRCLAQENRCQFQEVSAAESYQDIACLFTLLIRQVMDHLKYRADRRRYSGSKSMAKLINNVFGKRRKSVWWFQKGTGGCVYGPLLKGTGQELTGCVGPVCVHTVSNMDGYVKGWHGVSKTATTKCTEDSFFHSFAAFSFDFHVWFLRGVILQKKPKFSDALVLYFLQSQKPF